MSDIKVKCARCKRTTRYLKWCLSCYQLLSKRNPQWFAAPEATP